MKNTGCSMLGVAIILDIIAIICTIWAAIIDSKYLDVFGGVAVILTMIIVIWLWIIGGSNEDSYTPF